MHGSRSATVVASCIAGGVLACGALAGCGQAAAVPAQPPSRQQCVQAVFDVLSGMFQKPYDNRPFESFITRYGTQSTPYAAYLDVFTSFYSLSSARGVLGAETRLRPVVSRDCATS